MIDLPADVLRINIAHLPQHPQVFSKASVFKTCASSAYRSDRRLQKPRALNVFVLYDVLVVTSASSRSEL